MPKISSSIFYNLSEKAYLIYCRKTNGICNNPFFSKMESALGRIFSFFSSLISPKYIISGTERNGSNKIKIMCCGGKQQFYYGLSLIFEGDYEVKKVGNCSIFRLNKLLKNIPDDIDLVFLSTDRFFSDLLSKKVDFVIPEWVGMELDTSKSFSQIKSRFSNGALKDVKMIEKYGYTYEITDDNEKLEFFYNRMFLPFILDKFSEETPQSYLEYIKILIRRKNIKLLLVKDGDKYVAGGLIRAEKDKVVLPSMGILDAKSEYLRNYASSALFYFHILNSVKAGIKNINYGNTRAFLNDGSFQYKKKWGMAVIKSKFKFNVVGLKILNFNNSVLSYLENNSFIFVQRDKFKIFSYFNKNSPVTFKDIKQICRSYYCSGFEEILIFSSSDFAKEVYEKSSFEASSKYKFEHKIIPGELINNDLQLCVVKPID